ncbi:MAG: carbohydrate-binding domain-containing protein [Erysipelotrichaceae bacterium]|nr:carbohydrate-binding domain-containing protein [Erysipelotrichaceae bacterium]
MKATIRVITIAVSLLLVVGIVIFGINNGTTPEEAVENQANVSVNVDTGSAVAISLEDGASSASSSGIQIDGDHILISNPGQYVLSGSLSDGQVEVNCNGNVVLILNGADITCLNDSAIKISDADLAVIHLEKGTTNTLTSGDESNTLAEDAEGAALYARDDLTINGQGSLAVYGYINNGIASTDNLVIESGTISVEALNNGVKGKDNVTINNGDITISSGNDGIKTDNTETGMGNIQVNNGTLTIKSGGDGIAADANLTIVDGDLKIEAGNTENIQNVSDNNEVMQMFENMGMGPQGNSSNMSGERPQMMGQGNQMPMGQSGEMPAAPGAMEQFNVAQTSTASSDDGSYKGLKAGTMLTINGGSIEISAEDDAIHSNGDIEINGGSIVINTGDDGIHADGTLTFNAGDVVIENSYEGIEATTINVIDGEISVTSSDDGFNASSDTTTATLTISGGNVYVNTRGDGLDSNGQMYIEGGTIIVDGPSDNGNGALDGASNDSLKVNGGTIIAIGSSGMAAGFSGNSSQASLMLNLNGNASANTIIRILDEQGDVLFQHISAKAFSNIIFSCSELEAGNTYTVEVNGTQYSATAAMSTAGSGMGGNMMPGRF